MLEFVRSNVTLQMTKKLLVRTIATIVKRLSGLTHIQALLKTVTSPDSVHDILW